LKKLHIHLSGIEYGPKGEKNHLALDKSDLKLKYLFGVLNDFGCGQNMTPSNNPAETFSN
jgi:deoxyribonuclease IV